MAISELPNAVNPEVENLSQLCEAALEHARRGIRVHPVSGVNDEGECLCGRPDCTGKQRGKHPILHGWHRAATTDEHQIRAWWKEHPRANIGLTMGKESGLFCIDVDDSLGEETLQTLIDEHGPLPETPECQTGRGRHIFFRHPGDRRISGKAHALGRNVDLRGDGNYVLGAGSRHYTGANYEWEMSSHPDDIPFADPPDWLLDLICGPEQGAEPTKAAPRANIFKGVSEGERNDRLAEAVRDWKDRGLGSAEILTLAHGANAQFDPPLPGREVERIVQSNTRYPQRRVRLSAGQEAIIRAALPRLEERDPSVLEDALLLNALAQAERDTPALFQEAKQSASGRGSIWPQLSRGIKKSRLQVIQGTADTDGEEDNGLRGAIDEVRATYADMDAPVDYAEVSKAALRWLRDNGAQFYRTRTNEPFMSFRNETYWLNSRDRHQKGAFESLLFREAGLLQTSPMGRAIAEGLRHLAVAHGRILDALTWSFTDFDHNCIYFNLNNDRHEIVKISPTGVELIPNGDNPEGILLAPSDKIAPIEYIEDVDLQEGCGFILDYFMKSMACAPIDQFVIFTWMASFLLLDFSSTRPILRIDGDAGSGKTKAEKDLSTVIYGRPIQKKTTTAAAFADAERNPLQCWDNLETAQASPELIDFLLITATGGAKEKRKADTDSGTVVETPRSLVVTCGIDPVGAEFSEILSRTFTVTFSSDFMQGAGYVENTVLADLRSHRNEILSWIFKITSRVLAMIQRGDLHRAKALLDTEMKGHAKRRANDYIALMYLVSIAGAPDEIVEERLTRLDDVFRRWIRTQDETSIFTGSEGSPIATCLLGLFDKWRRVCLRDDSAKDQFTDRYGIEFADQWTIEGAESRALFMGMKAIAKEFSINLPISSPVALGKRLSSDAAAIRRAGLEIEKDEGRSRKAHYTIRLQDNDGEGW